MARNYCVPGNCSNAANSTNGIVNIIASTTSLPSIFEINSGSDATADNAVKNRIADITAIGTAQGAITPTMTNSGAGTAVAAVFTANQGASALPTYGTKTYLQFAHHQRTAYRWVAPSPQRQIFLPSTNSNGAGWLTPVITATFNQVFDLGVEE